MTGTKDEVVMYRLQRAKDTLEDAKILADNQRWNSAINRLYYASYYAITALLLDADLKQLTHNGVKSNFSEYFIKTNRIDREFGKLFAQLFTFRQKGDYDDLFDLSEDKVIHYFSPVADLIKTIEGYLTV